MDKLKKLTKALTRFNELLRTMLSILGTIALLLDLLQK